VVMTLQDAAVAVFVVAGATVLVRRLVRSLRPHDDATCPNCASGAAACAKPTPTPTAHDA